MISRISRRAAAAGAVTGFVAEAIAAAGSAGGDMVVALLARLHIAALVGAGLGAALTRGASVVATTMGLPRWWAVLTAAVGLAWSAGVRADVLVAGRGTALAIGLVVLVASAGITAWTDRDGSSRVSLLFLVSGFAALVYQVAWQRALFTAFGVDIESTTVVVSLFMVGLGVGALLGGAVSRRAPARLLWLFAGTELVIGMFGIFSVPLIRAVARRWPTLDLPGQTLATWAILGLPTLMMGATLPILVAHVTATGRNAGLSVALLYGLNTLGAALAAIVTAELLLALCGLSGSTVVGAMLNVLVAVMAVRLGMKGDGARVRPRDDASPPRTMGLFAGLSLAGLVAFVSLSQEMVWFRVVDYATHGDPRGFGRVLAAFLTGLASAAALATRVTRKHPRDALRMVAILLLVSGPLYGAAIPLSARAATLSPGLGTAALLASVGGTGFLLGGVFPLLCRVLVLRADGAGWGVALVYVANILGSVVGPLVTGMLLLDLLELRELVVLFSVLPALLGLWVLLVYAPGRGSWTYAAFAGVVLTIGEGFIGWDRTLERFHFGDRFDTDVGYQRVIHNRSGIVAVHPGPTDPLHRGQSSVVYGNGVYDGRLSIDPTIDENRILRSYVVPAIHPSPGEVLVIGLGGGAWSRALLAHPDVRRMTIVEINSAYVEIAGSDPVIGDLLHDARVTIVVDDGRRWLRRHPDRKFDVIVCNTTIHARAYSTNLLSVEFFRELGDHLRPGGLAFVNPTGSRAVARTAAEAFAFVANVHAELVLGHQPPVERTPDQRRAALRRFSSRGEPIFHEDDPAAAAVLEILSETRTENVAEALRGLPETLIVTDDNLRVEFGLWR